MRSCTPVDFRAAYPMSHCEVSGVISTLAAAARKPAAAAGRHAATKRETNRMSLLVHGLQVFKQIGHLLYIDLLFEIPRHGRKVGRIHVLDILALDDVLLAVL